MWPLPTSIASTTGKHKWLVGQVERWFEGLGYSGRESICSAPEPKTSPRGHGTAGTAESSSVKEFEAEATSRVHAAGRKMTSDVVVAAGATRLFLDGTRENSCVSKRGAKVGPSERQMLL